MITAALDIGTIITEIAGLSFLGLGAAPPAAEWGSMMSGARNLLQTAPWTIFVPGAAIFITVAIFQLFADSLRDLADSKNAEVNCMNNKFKYLLTALLGAALLVSGCGSDAAKQPKKKGRYFIMGPWPTARLCRTPAQILMIPTVVGVPSLWSRRNTV